MEPLAFCFGEILLRMSPELGGRWLADAQMPVYIGGAEANVARALAQWGLPVTYGTAMPEHYLSREIETNLQGLGVRTSVLWTGSRIGTYYLPQGSDLQHAGVIYDRAHSSFAELVPGMIDWETVLKGTTWFHFSAISPALTPSVASVCREALEAATRLGITVSIDLNYRAKLWQYGASPIEVMPELVQYCDVVMGNPVGGRNLVGHSSRSGGSRLGILPGTCTDHFRRNHAQVPQVPVRSQYFSLRAGRPELFCQPGRHGFHECFARILYPNRRG